MRSFAFFLSLAVLLGASSVMAQAPGDRSETTENLERVNALREQAGAPPLTLSPELSEAARVHVAEMSSLGRLIHVSETTGTPVDRVHAAGLEVDEIAENVSMRSDAGGAQEALEGSDAHLSNMLNPRFTHMGVALLHTRSGVYLTQVFARVEGATAPPPSAPVPQLFPVAPEVAATPPLDAGETSGVAEGEPPALFPADPEGTLPEAAPQAVPQAAAQGAAIGAPGQVVLVRTPSGESLGYWVCSSARWWYYPMTPGVASGQLQPDLTRTDMPSGYGACAPGESGPVTISPRSGAAPTVSSAPTYAGAPAYAAPRIAQPGQLTPGQGSLQPIQPAQPTMVLPAPYVGSPRIYYAPGTYAAPRTYPGTVYAPAPAPQPYPYRGRHRRGYSRTFVVR